LEHDSLLRFQHFEKQLLPFVILSALQRSETKSKNLSPFAFGQHHRENNVRCFDPFDFAQGKTVVRMTIVLIALSDPQ